LDYLTQGADENRERVLHYAILPNVLQQLQDPELVSVAVPVVYNICVDYGLLHLLIMAIINVHRTNATASIPTQSL
jgi:hypothetical protein